MSVSPFSVSWTTMHYYNDHEPYVCQWLRNLIDAGELPEGDVDERSIAEVLPSEIDGYVSCHFFAGIGGWAKALRIAGWPESLPVWTASLPCQPFSTAGKRKAEEDERHLWPIFLPLVRKLQPARIFGEQVSSDDGRDWLDRISADLEEVGYAVGAADLPAACVDLPHKRQRLFWVAERLGNTYGKGFSGRGLSGSRRADKRSIGETGSPPVSPIGGVVNPYGTRQQTSNRLTRQPEQGAALCRSSEMGSPDGVGDALCKRPLPQQPERSVRSQRDSTPPGVGQNDGVANASMSARDGTIVRDDAGQDDRERNAVVYCSDGFYRRISPQPGDEPLAHGIPRDVGPLLAGLEGMGQSPERAKKSVKYSRRNRVGRLRGYGNAIVPAVAALFVQAYMQVRNITGE